MKRMPPEKLKTAMINQWRSVDTILILLVGLGAVAMVQTYKDCV
uniref:Uncharacterized protein n=1 Tax=uncultured marine microorganism TaxID=415540 RepID=A5CFT4_9ZZZZ|nr:hypothetical protein [uncultured marine microorganism]